MEQSVVTSPEVTFTPEALELSGGHLPWVKEALALGLDFAARKCVPVLRVVVTRWDSYEDPDGQEVVITYHVEWAKSLQALGGFAGDLADYLGNWEQTTLPKRQQEFFWKCVWTRVEPANDVQP
ncbi:MAG: hypothetical protein HY681_13370 [Chloroflexi bacterium]|nr:hypothetical protein [Chloroflexota bacterium]